MLYVIKSHIHICKSSPSVHNKTKLFSHMIIGQPASQNHGL